MCLDPHSAFSTEEKGGLFSLCFLASYITFCILSFLLFLFLFSPFLNQIAFLLLCFKSSLYILDNSPLSDISFANIYTAHPHPPQSMAYLLLLTLSFAGQRFLIMISLDARQCQFSNFFSSINVLNILSRLSLHKTSEPVSLYL